MISAGDVLARLGHRSTGLIAALAVLLTSAAMVIWRTNRAAAKFAAVRGRDDDGSTS